MTTKTTAIISYCSFAGWLVAYLAGDKEGARFHLNQSLVLLIAGLMISCFSIMGGFVHYFTPILYLAHTVVWLIGFIDACRGKETEIPVVSEIQILK